MDFHTRDRYRHAVEQVAKRSELAESEVARKAIDLAAAGAAAGSDSRGAHVGFHLIDHGRRELEKLAHVRRSPGMIAGRALRRHSLTAYLFIISLAAIILSALFCLWLWRHGNHKTAWVAAPLVLLCASQFGVGFANWLTTLLVRPRAIPRMDFTSGIPSANRTLVAVPTMLSSAAGVEELLEGLEVRYLANRDEHLHFALLTDLRDASQRIPACRRRSDSDCA